MRPVTFSRICISPSQAQLSAPYLSHDVSRTAVTRPARDREGVSLDGAHTGEEEQIIEELSLGMKTNQSLTIHGRDATHTFR